MPRQRKESCQRGGKKPGALVLFRKKAGGPNKEGGERLLPRDQKGMDLKGSGPFKQFIAHFQIERGAHFSNVLGEREKQNPQAREPAIREAGILLRPGGAKK